MESKRLTSMMRVTMTGNTKSDAARSLVLFSLWDGKRVYHIEMILKSSKQINYSLEMQRVRKPKAVNGQSGTTMGNLTDGT